MRTSCVEVILEDSYTVYFASLHNESFCVVLGAYFAQFPNRDHKITPRMPPTRTGTPEDIPEATYANTVPGQVPVSTILLTRKSPPIKFPSYQCKQFKLESLRSSQGAMIACLPISMRILFEMGYFI
jgi:hypothetical protein